jgi:hypothetical protein
MNVMAIGDQPAETFVVRECHPHHAGFPAIHLAHRVENMREGASAGFEGRLDFSHHRFGMAEAHQHAFIGKRFDQRGLHAIRRQRQHHAAAIGIGDPFNILCRHLADELFGMGAFALDIEKRALDMDAEHARNALGDCRSHGGDRRFGHLRRVGDDRRQHPGRAEFPVRLGDAPHAINRGMIIEQGAATAVCLHVDEARCQQAAAQRAALEIGR